MRVVLISLFDGGTYGHRSVSAALQANDIEVFDIFGLWYIQDLKDLPEIGIKNIGSLVKEIKPDLIGISVTSTLGFAYARQLSLALRHIGSAPIIFGGVHCTLTPHITMVEAQADFVCIGEGEESIVDLCKNLSAGDNGEGIPGIMTKLNLTYIPRGLPQHLDTLPFQKISDNNSYSILVNGTICPGDFKTKDKVYSTRCSRGCPFQCSFCSNFKLRSLSGPGNYFRRRSVKHVIEELIRHKKINTRCESIWFWDDTFPTETSWVVEFAQQYKEHIDLPFTAWFNPKAVIEENIRLLADAGLKNAIMGIDSASPATRNGVFLRKETDEDISNADTIFSKMKLSKQYDFIINHPWECSTELQDIFKMALNFKPPFTLNMHDLIILPGTKLAERAVKEGIIKDDADVVSTITSDAYSMSRRIQWIKGMPLQKNFERSYWVKLIFLTESRLSRIFLFILSPGWRSKKKPIFSLWVIPTWFLFKIYIVIRKAISFTTRIRRWLVQRSCLLNGSIKH